MKSSLLLLCSIAMLAWLPAAQAAPAAPSEAKVSRDVTAYWHEHWPDQEVAHVSRKTEQCEPGEAELKGRRGKPIKVKTCLVRVDVYVARGYRYFIYRGTEAHYRGRRLVSVQLGELEKAWKAGGVPPPEAEQLAALITAAAAEQLGDSPQVTVVEVGRPRPFGDFYRLSAVVDVAYTKDGQAAKREHVLVTLQSDGGDWRVVPDLSF